MNGFAYCSVRTNPRALQPDGDDSACDNAIRRSFLPAVGPVKRSPDRAESQTVEQAVQPEISRKEWRERVRAAKRRARENDLERRRHREDFAPQPPEDPALIASERVLGNDSLQPRRHCLDQQGPVRVPRQG
jgi:hypothetical protein